ncbi:hypothetical protein BDM02DRAFT_3194523 [Thelephora ganbajun]|uniref:Uncharacterized protein n=1 Tax=Thelephora ganbajun TaxID=370292 RepID=A0ACB6YWI0_THEGA|nr:hypothetical protein BDM02DRAFT_3194523 [Thelephora ganbajun]
MPNSTVFARLRSSDNVGGELQLIFPISQEEFDSLLAGEIEAEVHQVRESEVVRSGAQDEEDNLEYSDGWNVPTLLISGIIYPNGAMRNDFIVQAVYIVCIKLLGTKSIKIIGTQRKHNLHLTAHSPCHQTSMHITALTSGLTTCPVAQVAPKLGPADSASNDWLSSNIRSVDEPRGALS